MLSLLQILLRFIIKHAIGFVAILVILMAGAFAHKEFAKYNETADVLQSANHGKVDLLQSITDKEKAATARVNGLEKATLKVLKDRIDALDQEIKLRSADRLSPSLTLCVIRGGKSCDRYFHELRVTAELSLLAQERDYLSTAYAIASNKSALAFGAAELERLRKLHVVADAALKVKEDEVARFKGSMRRFDRLNPWSKDTQELKVLERERKELLANNQIAYVAWARQNGFLNTFKIPRALKKFEVHRDQLNSELQKLTNEIDELTSHHKDNWVAKVQEMTRPFVPMALGILLSIILAPIAIKSFLYFVIAPLATSRPPVRLMPDTSGNMELFDENASRDASPLKISAVSQSIVIDQTQEILVHPEYLSSSADRGKKDTKWLLSYSYPLSSLAAGMYGLTRIRTSSTDEIVVSSRTESHSEVGVISLQQNSALIFQPHNLIGIVQNTSDPIRITKHWRLSSLQAWLTLQLRFLVFHGPARLIVTGHRGIQVENLRTSRSINQAATIGFSTNLEYSTTRCETFGSYLMGKQELFNDKFSGGPGFFVYEVAPREGKKSGLTGRGLEGILDSFLKVFGV